MNDNFIDSLAAFGKFGIENSNLTRDEKEWSKSGVDCVANLLKVLQTHPETPLTVMGLNFKQIFEIKKAAAQYSIEKVVLFPYFDGRNVLSLIRAYGKNKEQFFRSIGWHPLQLNTYLEFSPFDQFEKDFGVILYENE